MTRERFLELFDNTKSNLSKFEGDNAFLGLQILSKYTNKLIEGADHDIIYSCDIDDVLDNITEEEVIKLAELNWSLSDDDYFTCFV